MMRPKAQEAAAGGTIQPSPSGFRRLPSEGSPGLNPVNFIAPSLSETQIAVPALSGLPSGGVQQAMACGQGKLRGNQRGGA